MSTYTTILINATSTAKKRTGIVSQVRDGDTWVLERAHADNPVVPGEGEPDGVGLGLLGLALLQAGRRIYNRRESHHGSVAEVGCVYKVKSVKGLRSAIKEANFTSFKGPQTSLHDAY